MIRPLLFRPIPFYDETAGSILIRCAKENGHGSVHQLLAGAGILIHPQRLHAALADPNKFRHIVEHLGLPSAAASLPLRRVSTSIRSAREYRSAVIPDRYFRRNEASAYCASCLREKPYLRRQWLLRPFSVCRRHKRLLVDRCLNCNRVPSVGRGEITLCNHCQTSLLTMNGGVVDISAIDVIEKLFTTAKTDLLDYILGFWIALSLTDGKQDSPAVQYARLEAAVAFSQGDVAAFNHVVVQVVRRLPLMGPRAQLLPFLLSSPSLNRFADEIISAVWPLSNIGVASSRLPCLSDYEILSLLNLPSEKLVDLITKGLVCWQDNHPRNVEVAEIEKEMLQHGFSQTEILQLYLY